jgi:hypothetical protein
MAIADLLYLLDNDDARRREVTKHEMTTMMDA